MSGFQKDQEGNVSESLRTLKRLLAETDGQEWVIGEGLTESEENIIASWQKRRLLLCDGGKFNNTVTCSNLENRKYTQ